MNPICRMIRRISVAGILLVILCCFSAGAQAGGTIRAGYPSGCTETVTARVNSSGNYILSLPGFWDTGKITLELEGAECLYIGKEKQEVRPGEETDLSALVGENVPVYDARKRLMGNLAVHQGSEIPALFLTVDEKELKKVNKSKDNVITEGRAVYAEADGSVSYDGGITQLKGRGNNTFSYSKKPYQIKLEKKAGLSGMSKAKTWVLLANWNDTSFLRNQIVMDMCREAGLRYAISCVQADVWINGAYNGLYLITEKIQIGKNRIDLRDLEEETEALNDAPPESFSRFKYSTKELPLVRGYEVPENPEDITGGYIVVIEKYARLRDFTVPGFRTQKDLSIRIKEPTYPSREQTEYLANLFNEMHRAVIAEDGINPQTGKSYREYIDTASCALKYLAEDWSKNYDFIGGSQFMYKDSDSRDPLIYAGPPWDYDLAFGNMRDRGYKPTGNYVSAISRKTSNFYWLLSCHDDFMKEVREAWQRSFRPAAAILLGEAEPAEGSVIRPLDEYAEAIRKSAAMNAARWGIAQTTAETAGNGFAAAVRYLKSWIQTRTAYMDGVYGVTEKHE